MYVYSICMRQYDVNIEMCLNLLGPLSEPLSENQYFSEVLTQALMSDWHGVTESQIYIKIGVPLEH